MNHYPDARAAWVVERELSQDQRWAQIEENKEDYTSRWGENPAVRCLHFHILIHLPEPSKDFYEGVHRLIRLALNNNLILPPYLNPTTALIPAFHSSVLSLHAPTHLPTSSPTHILTRSECLLLGSVPLHSLRTTVFLWMRVWHSYLSWSQFLSLDVPRKQQACFRQF